MIVSDGSSREHYVSRPILLEIVLELVGAGKRQVRPSWGQIVKPGPFEIISSSSRVAGNVAGNSVERPNEDKWQGADSITSRSRRFSICHSQPGLTLSLNVNLKKYTYHLLLPSNSICLHLLFTLFICSKRISRRSISIINNNKSITDVKSVLVIFMVPERIQIKSQY